MAENRKLGRTADHRVAMLKNMATSLIWHGQIETTEAKAKEVKSIVDSLISLAIKEKDNFEEVEVKVSRAKLDANGCKVTEKTTGNFLTKVSIDYGDLINDNSHILDLFEDTTITFTNYKEEEKYQLTLYKECKNITEGTFNFTVTGPSNYKKDLTLSCQGKEVLTDLVKG